MNNHSYPQTTFASDALLKACLGKEVTITIDQVGTDPYTLLQVDKYHVIVKTEDGDYWLISKNAILTLEAPDTALPEIIDNIAEGVKQINYKASRKRLERNKNKQVKKDYSHIPVRPMAIESQGTSREVHVVTKQRKSYQR